MIKTIENVIMIVVTMELQNTRSIRKSFKSRKRDLMPSQLQEFDGLASMCEGQ